MAKLTGPLFSLSASGKLAKTLVYADWKGIDYARQYVIPSNPNSAGQQTQRGFLTTAVAQWQDVVNVLNTLDKANLNRAAGLEAKPMSGFNVYVRGVVDCLVGAFTNYHIFATVEGVPAAGAIQIVASSVVDANGVELRYGTSSRSLNNIVYRTEAPVAGATHTFDLAGLTPGVTYFYKILNHPTTPNNTLGIGTFLAA